MIDQLALFNRLPRSCVRNQSRENLLKRTKIVLAVPSYHRQRLSGIRRGWCPPRSRRMKGVIRSDSGVAHRLSLSARVLSAAGSQVKAKRQSKKRLRHLQNQPSQRTRKACQKRGSDWPYRIEKVIVKTVRRQDHNPDLTGRRFESEPKPAGTTNHRLGNRIIILPGCY